MFWRKHLPVLDWDEMVSFIAERVEIDKSVLLDVLDAETEYLLKVGIAVQMEQGVLVI